MKRAIRITIRNETIPVMIPENNGEHELRIMQDAVGGYIEEYPSAYHGYEDLCVWVNEEGLFTDEPNPLATALFSNGLGTPPVVGDVLVTGIADDEGDLQSLAQELFNVFITDSDDLAYELNLAQEKLSNRVRPDGPETAEGGLIGQQPY